MSFATFVVFLRYTDVATAVSYADFQLVAILHWAKRADESVFERLVAFEPAFGTVYEAAAPYLKRDT